MDEKRDPKRLGTALLGAVIGVLLVIGVPVATAQIQDAIGGPEVTASPGDPLLLGNTNVIDAVTTVKSGVAKPLLVLQSTGTAGTALRLHVQDGRPPMMLNSSVKVSDLNADLLDGLDSTDFVAAADYQAEIAALEARVAALEMLLQDVTRITHEGRDTLRLTGMNLQVVNGTGTTNGLPNGEGNVLIGYDTQSEGGLAIKTGSHNLVVGDQHTYTHYSGIVAGTGNSILGVDAFASGRYNRATTSYSFVAGGQYNVVYGESSFATGYGNETQGRHSFISGFQNTVAADADFAFVAGGRSNTAGGPRSFVGGGRSNTAGGDGSFVAGGQYSTAGGDYSFAGAGVRNRASGDYSAVAGWVNHAAGDYSFVGGGRLNVADGDHSFVGGGQDNAVRRTSSFVGGGQDNTVTGAFAFVAGGQDNTVYGDHAFVTGSSNTASGHQSFASGLRNRAAGLASFVAGGYDNNANGGSSFIGAGSANSTKDRSSFVGGGDDNTAYGENSFVGGGRGNLANHYAFVGGGEDDLALWSGTHGPCAYLADELIVDNCLN